MLYIFIYLYGEHLIKEPLERIYIVLFNYLQSRKISHIVLVPIILLLLNDFEYNIQIYINFVN